MSVNQNQQINVFNKGMNTDTSDAYLSNEQYRYAENLRFITNTGENSGELRLIEGYKQVYKDPKYFHKDEQIVAVTSVRDLLVLLTNYNKNCAIVVINVTSGSTYRPFVAENAVWGGEHYSLVTRWEDDDNIKLYVADGVNPLRVFRIDKKADNKPWASSFSSIDKTDNGTFGGFGEITRTNGQLKPAMVQYVYQMYDNHGKSSHVSPLSRPIKLYNSDSNVDSGVMYTENSVTSVGLTVHINEYKGIYEKIKVYRISYQQVGQLPLVELIIDEPLTEDHFVFTDRGQSAISQESFAEFLSNNYITPSPQYIESKGDYLFVANNQYQYAAELATKFNEYDASAQPPEEYSLDFNVSGDNWKYWIDHWCESENIKWKFKTTSEELTDRHEGKSKTLQRGEIYRYGILFYDVYGNKWPVKWIVDVRIPNTKPIQDVDGKLNKILYSIEFNVSATDDFKQSFPSYEIVRCPRNSSDRHIISQGIVGKAVHNYKESFSTTYYPSGFMTMGTLRAYSYDADGDNSQGEYYSEVSTERSDDKHVLMFASPEISYNDTFVQNLVTSSSKLEMTYEYTTDYEEIDFGEHDRLLFPMNATTHAVAFDKIEDHHEVGVFRFGDRGQGFLCYGDEGVRIEISGGNYVKLHPNFNANVHEDYLTNTRRYEDFIEHRGETTEGSVPAFNCVVVEDFDDFVYGKSIGIDDKNYVKSPLWNEFHNENDFTYRNDIKTVGEFNFINWSAAMIAPFIDSKKDEITSFYNDDSGGGVLTDNRSTLYNPWNVKDWTYRYPIGSGGSCMIISSSLQGGDFDSRNVVVANIVNNTIPYGGFSEYQRTNSVYQSYGNYFTTYGEHEVIDGDCDIQWFYYNALHTWYSPNIRFAPKMATVYKVPIETIIDMNSDSGDSYKRVYNENIQDEPVQNFKDYTQTNAAYMYNTAYSSEPTLQPSSGLDEEDVNNNKFDYRIMYSNPKLNNEAVDNWLNFQSNNYIDVDTRYGEITNMRLFKNSLVFWQKNAVGVLSVNERTIIQDTNETNIILGDSGVLQRYDYLSTKYGMAPHQMCDSQSDSVLYWWDEYNRDLVQYPGGQSVQPMKIAKNVSSLINQRDIENPQLVYDNRYKEILFSTVRHVDNSDEKTLVYNEMIQQFTSVYNINFQFAANVEDKTFLFKKDNNVYLWNEQEQDMFPLLKYVVNDKNTFTKVYDNVQIGMGESFYFDQFYNGETDTEKRDNQPLTFKFNTTEQHSQISKNITNREYDLRFAVPRNAESTMKYANNWGERMRGRTMQCELTSSSSSTGFSIQYIITKYRISWS